MPLKPQDQDYQTIRDALDSGNVPPIPEDGGGVVVDDGGDQPFEEAQQEESGEDASGEVIKRLDRLDMRITEVMSAIDDIPEMVKDQLMENS